MVARIPAPLAERVLAAHPMPIADAVAALLAADSVFEMRDRVVEVFRAELRLLAAFVLAARLQHGSGPGGDVAQVPDLLRALRSRGLTDGQWVALLREALRPWAGAANAHPLPELVTMVHARKSELVKLFDELLVMRKSETVAHGATGTRAAIEEILGRRVPQLARTLELLDPLWSAARLCVPVAATEGEGTAQSAWLLMGSTPHRGRFRKVELDGALDLQPGEAVLVGSDDKPVIALHPIVMVRKPSPDVAHEVFLLDGGTKRGAVYVAFPSMAEHRESDAWVAIEGALSDTEPLSEEGTKVGADRPYRGLSSFGPEEAGLFFGREEQAEALANRIRRNGFITVTGPSGSGKTSLLRAGVLPLLRDAKTTFVRPGPDPIASLATKLAITLDRDRAKLEAACRNEPDELVHELDAQALDAESIHVVVVDQGEEALTLCSDPEAREAFGRLLVKMAGTEGGLRVVFGVREDFFGRLATIASLREIYSRNVEVVTTPDRTALFRTLIAPAQVFGYSFEDEELVTQMVDEVTDAPAALALLQFCADRLWEQRDRKWKRLTWDAYRGMGGVAGALASHADRVVQSLSNVERGVVRSLFLRLVSGERTRAVLTKSELLDGLPDPDAAARVLDVLLAARLLAIGDDASGNPTVEIVHEALIRHWTQLDRWLSEDEEGQKLAHALRQAAREWNQRKRARDLVWRGDVLDELRRYRKRTTEPLAGIEAAFADASEADERRGRRIRIGLVSAALALSTGFSAFALWQWRTTESARASAESARSATAHEKTNAEIRGLVAEARGHEPSGRSGHALALLRAASALEAEQGESKTTLLSLELERLERAGPGGMVLAGHTAAVYRMCIPTDADRVVTSSFDETTRVWELSTGRLLHTIPSQGNIVRALACSPDGRTFATGASDARDEKATLSLWRVDDATFVRSFPGPSIAIDAIEFSEDGSELLSFGQDSKLWFFDVESGEPTRTIEPPGRLTDYDATPSGDWIAMVDGDGISLWARTGDAPVFRYPEKKLIAGMAVSDDGARIAYSTVEGGVVPIIDTSTGSIVKEIVPAGTLGVAHLQFIQGGRSLVTSGPRGIDVWDGTDGRRLRSIRVDPQHTSFYFSQNGERLVTLRSGVVAELWDVETGARLASLSGHDGSIQTVAFSVDGRTVATGSYDRTARVYDAERTALVHFGATQEHIVQVAAASAHGRWVATAAPLYPLRVHETAGEGLEPRLVAEVGGARVVSAAFSGDEKRVAVALESGHVTILTLPDGRRERTIELESAPTALAWAPDGAIAVAMKDGSIALFGDAARPRWTLPTNATMARLLEFDPTGRLLAIGRADGGVTVVGGADGASVGNVAPSTGPPTVLRFSPDGASLVVGDNLGARKIDTATWKEEPLAGHEQSVLACVFSPDGAIVATASADQSIRLFEAGGKTRVLSGHTAAVTDVVFSSDGKWLLSAAQDGTARQWDVQLGALLDILEPFGGYVTLARFSSADRVVAVGTRHLAVLESKPADRSASLQSSGASTNLRVCRDSFSVVPIVPLPEAGSVWAPAELCTR